MGNTQNRRSLNWANSTSDYDPFTNTMDLDGVALIDLTGDDELDLGHIQQALRVNKSLRNYALDADHHSVKQVVVDGSQYEVGHFVELRELVGLHGIEFIEIKSINVHKQTGGFVIRGLPYARTRNVQGRLPRRQNEVCLILEIDADDARADEEQSLVEIVPQDIKKKRILTNTNKAFPHCRFDRLAYATTKQKEEQAPLCCRWKMRIEYKDVSQRRAGRTHDLLVLEHFSERDGHKIKKRNLGVDEERSRDWRGETIRGGSTFCEPDFIKDENQDSKPTRIQQCSFAEIPAGAGGASRGAEMAGFKVVLAVEPCPHACKSYRANFPNTELHEIKVEEFIKDGSQTAVDILHISSSALDGVGDNPEAAKQRCTDLLKSVPRFVSMEQPAAIMSERSAPVLNAIMQSFTEAGYSIQSKMVHMVEYGLPQMRKRFILLGAGPGEVLPSWPIATHSSNPTGDQQPLVSEQDAIGGLTPELHSLHEPDSMRVIDKLARDADKPIESPINNNGSVLHHPDGERDFTHRELACLQGYPTYHRFEGSYIKKQIANAIPPSVAMAFYQHLRQHMEEVDGVQGSPSEPVEPTDYSNASLPEVTNDSATGSVLYEESSNGQLDAAMTNAPPDTPPDVGSSVQPARSPTQQRMRGAALPPSLLMSPMSSTSPSPRLTMSPEAQSDGEPMPSASHTPSSAHLLPTPSTGGRFVPGNHTGGLQLKRGRALFEEPESDGDDDDDGPMALETPSKRPRLFVAGDGTDDRGSERSRTTSRSSEGTNRVAEDMPMSENADEPGGSGPDDETVANLAQEL